MRAISPQACSLRSDAPRSLRRKSRWLFTDGALGNWLGFMVAVREPVSHGKSKNEEARTQRTLVRGTAKRLAQKARQAAPIGARSVGFCAGLENSRFSD